MTKPATSYAPPPGGGTMPRILFVDDEPHVLEGLREGLRQNRSRWEMSYALGGADALAAFKRDPFDVVVTDLAMPGMDGAELLARIQRDRPITGRIVLGDDMDRSFAVRSAACAHRVLAKPCDRVTLEHAIEAGIRLSVAAMHPTMKALVAKTMRLPSPPTTYLALTEAMRDPEAKVESMASILERDPAMTAQVLRVVNSPLFGVRREITRVPQAIAMLGREMIKNLVLGLDVFRSFKELPAGARLSVETNHDHSLAVARMAQIVAGKALGDLAFTVGMLHDVGTLLVATTTPEALFEVHEAASERGLPDHVVEREVWGTTHAELGALLLGLWGLPVAVVDGVADHHDPPPYLPYAPQLATIVHVADAIAHERAGGVPHIDPMRLYALGIHDRIDGWRRDVAAAFESHP